MLARSSERFLFFCSFALSPFWGLLGCHHWGHGLTKGLVVLCSGCTFTPCLVIAFIFFARHGHESEDFLIRNGCSQMLFC